MLSAMSGIRRGDLTKSAGEGKGTNGEQGIANKRTSEQANKENKGNKGNKRSNLCFVLLFRCSFAS
jgi:hypothetical protein